MATKKKPDETLSKRFIWKKGDFQVIKKKDVKKKLSKTELRNYQKV